MEPGHEIVLVRLSPEYDISGFDCEDDDLDGFLADDALRYQEGFLANTTLLLCDGQLVTYFALAADSIRLSGGEKDKGGIDTPLNSFPALKLARLATDVRFRRRGHGTAAVEFCVGLARHLNDMHRHDGIGCRFVTVDAYPTAVAWYKSLGFVENETRRSQKDTVSLRLDVLPVVDIDVEPGEDQIRLW